MTFPAWEERKAARTLADADKKTRDTKPPKDTK